MKIDIVLPLPISGPYTYLLPEGLPCPKPGVRALVPLGKKRLTGIVLGIHQSEAQTTYQLRPIEAILDEEPIVSQQQIDLWQWISRYYMCPLGEVLIAALPAGIIDDNYTARMATYLQTGPMGFDAPKVEQMLARSPKQLQVWRTFRLLTAQHPLVERRILIEQSGESTAVVRALIERNILCQTEQAISRIQSYSGPIEPIHPLSKPQQHAIDAIQRSWQTHATTLLHGVTASGKTEVYIHLISEQLAQGHSVLYLVPEIALTTQLTDRLQVVFGKQLIVYHSRISNAERVEIYHAIRLSQQPFVVIGARSVVFLPITKLGLVVIDEEHESSYKQQDPAPRYHARAVALMLAQQQQAKTLLGTATPSIESYYNTEIGKFQLVELHQRYSGVSLPKTTIIDLKDQYHRKEMYGHFADPLVDKIRTQLAANKQIILFQNRRGYAPLLQCTGCGKAPRCVQCDVPLTIHLQQQQMRCHYCGYTTSIPTMCPDCGQPMKVHGFGTERLEDEVKQLFPGARVLRMDLDTTRSKTAYQDIINTFSRHEVDILIGTQMVTKGLHFDDVSLVAVLNADQLLNQPDFRSYERAFYMLEQVAGRAGRKGNQGEVVIQTFEPQNKVLELITTHDYQAHYQSQISERKMFKFPPFYRLIYISLKHHNLQRLNTTAELLQDQLKQVFGERVGDIITPAVSRIQSQHIREIRLRFEPKDAIARAKERLQEIIHWTLAQPNCKGTSIRTDVDPQ